MDVWVIFDFAFEVLGFFFRSSTQQYNHKFSINCPLPYNTLCLSFPFRVEVHATQRGDPELHPVHSVAGMCFKVSCCCAFAPTTKGGSSITLWLNQCWVQSDKRSAGVRMRLAKSYGTMIQRCCSKSISCVQKTQLLHKLSCPHPIPLSAVSQGWETSSFGLQTYSPSSQVTLRTVGAAVLHLPRWAVPLEGTQIAKITRETIGPLAFEPTFQVLHLYEQAHYHSRGTHICQHTLSPLEFLIFSTSSCFS